jgi:hypothetical protein
MIERSGEELGENRDDVEPHGESASECARLTNPASLLGDRPLWFGQPSRLAGKWN